MDAMIAHVRKFTKSDALGFRKSGERDGVMYEMHDANTANHDGAGYFRLHVRNVYVCVCVRVCAWNGGDADGGSSACVRARARACM